MTKIGRMVAAALAATSAFLLISACSSPPTITPACQRAYERTVRFVNSLQPSPYGPSFGELVTYRSDLNRMASAGCPSTMEVPSLPGS